MRKTFQSPQGIGIPVFRLKYDGRAQALHQTALPGDAELGGEGALHGGDDFHGNGIYHKDSS